MTDSETKEFWKVVSQNESKFATYVHPRATVDPTAKLGRNVKIWASTNVLQDVVIGDNCNIGACSELGRGTVIGKGSRIGFGVFLPPNSKIGENVFIGPNTTFCDDKNPRAGNPEYHAQPPVIENHAAIGAGVTVLPGITIGWGALVGAGSIVTKDVPANTIVSGQDYAKVRSSK